MNFIRSVCLFVFLSLVYVNALGVNDVSQGGADGTAALNTDNGEGRFLNLDGLLSDITKGIDFKVSQSQSQGSSFAKQVTQSHKTINGQTVIKTEISELLGNNPDLGLRFKRDLFEDLVEDVGGHAKVVKDKIAGAMADGVNLAHNGIYKVKNVINHGLRE